MSLYHIIFLWLLLCAVAEHIKEKTPKGLFLFSFFLLTVFLCLRFGQGTDYFSYAAIFRAVPMSPLAAAVDENIHAESVWKFLCATFKSLNASFPFFIFVLSLYIMAMLYRFIRNYGGERKLFILFLCYHTLYLTYFMSILRQAVVIATLLGLLLPLLEKRKYFRYYIVAAVLVGIHNVALVTFLFPILQNLRLKFKHCVAIAAIGLGLGTVLILIDLGSILSQLISHEYLREATISAVAIAERVLTFVIVSLCFYIYLDGKEPEQTDYLLIIYKIYAVGLLLYGLLMWSALISSRTVYILKVIELVLLAACIQKCKKSRLLVFLYCILLSTVLYVKNVGSYLEQGQYKNATILNYPYVTVFQQNEILNYREDTISYPFEQ